MFFIGTLRSLLPIAVVLSALLLINKFLKAEETLLVILSINPDDFISFIGTDICCLFPRTFIIPLTNLGVTNPNFIASIPKRIDAASLRFNCSISLNVKLPALPQFSFGSDGSVARFNLTPDERKYVKEAGNLTLRDIEQLKKPKFYGFAFFSKSVFCSLL